MQYLHECNVRILAHDLLELYEYYSICVCVGLSSLGRGRKHIKALSQTILKAHMQRRRQQTGEESGAGTEAGAGAKTGEGNSVN